MEERTKTGQKDRTGDFTESERKTADLIMKHPDNGYEDLLHDADWDVFYELSPLREGLLNWYPFRKNCEILEFSDGFGALTGILSNAAKNVTVLESCEKRAACIAKRYRGFTNITVAASCGEIPSDQRYDYIVVEKAADTRHEIEKLLEETGRLLKETGRLLFVCENRFGMKYWCGVPDPLSNSPFAGIRGRGKSSMMTRRDLTELFEQTGWIKGWNFYYPFPDHKMTQAVYSDRYLPKVSVRDRVIPYYRNEEQESLVCLEDEIWDALIANQVFHIFANSFLVECGKKALEPEVIYAALSTDRGKKHGFATVVSSRGTVRKKILHPDGKKSLRELHRNRQELEQHGISCVREILLEDAIEMPFIKKPVLAEYLRYLFRKEKDRVEAVFEQLYALVRMSSEPAAFTECAVHDERLTEENAGVILKKAYIDMIPYNCFYDDGRLLFYDQEFSRENFPAKYVLFRALRYTYIYIPEAEGIIPLQYFKDKYRFGQSWQAYEQVEAEFVEDNRNYDQMRSFYLWASVSRDKADRNIERLMKENEI